jgi:hypothetical protein
MRGRGFAWFFGSILTLASMYVSLVSLTRFMVFFSSFSIV